MSVSRGLPSYGRRCLVYGLVDLYLVHMYHIGWLEHDNKGLLKKGKISLIYVGWLANSSALFEL